MRALGIISIILGALVALGACLFYLFAGAMACGFRTIPGPCPIKFDWEMVQLVILPGAAINLALIFGGRHLIRNSRRD